MSGARAIVEDDGYDMDVGDGEGMVDVVATMADAVGSQTSALAPQPKADDAGHAEPRFTIVDTDDQFNPLDREATLSTDDVGDGTYLDNQRRQQQTEQRQGETRQSRRQRTKNARDANIAENMRLRMEIQELRSRLDGVEPRVLDGERERLTERLAQFDRNIGDQRTRAEQAFIRIAEAANSGNGEELAAALRDRDNAVSEAARLEAQQQTLKAAVQQYEAGGAVRPDNRGQPQQPPQRMTPPPPPPPAVQVQIEDFFNDHPWAARATGDELAAIKRLDANVAAMGHDPASDDYWNELERQMSVDTVLRHRFANTPPAARAPEVNQQPAPRRPGGPPMAGRADRPPAQPARGNNTVFLSPGRKESLARMGVISNDGTEILDQPRFQRMLAQYQRFDRENPPAASAGGARR